MEHYRCVTAHNPKTKGIATADAFYWSESNVYRLPKITPEEQLTLAAHDLAQAVRQNATFGLPNKELRNNTCDLVKLFRKCVDTITCEKLIPKSQEDITVECEEQSNSVSDRQEEDSSLRVETEDFSPREEAETDLINTKKDYLKGTLRSISPHIYPLRNITARY